MKWRLACVGVLVLLPAIASAAYPCWGLWCSPDGQVLPVPAPAPAPSPTVGSGGPYCWGLHCRWASAVAPAVGAGSASVGSVPPPVSGGPYIWQQASAPSPAARAALFQYAMMRSGGELAGLPAVSGGVRGGASGWAMPGDCNARCGNNGLCRALQC